MKQIVPILKYYALLSILTAFGFLVTSVHLPAQVDDLNTGNPDTYRALRSMVSLTSTDNTDTPNLEYRLNEGQKFYVRYFIGAHTFTLKSDIDILNRIIHAKLKFSAEIKPYDYERSRIDSLYLLINEDDDPVYKYLYNPQKDAYGKVIDQGKFTLIEIYELTIRKGKTNPVLDSGTVDDRLVVKKIPYLLDTGRWYPIPKSKNQLIDFIKKHYRRTITKKSIESGSPINTLKAIN